ncbi:hypothetical protein XENOCAPTIV_023444 [Xenoophorus captivus]|uniref:Uncharacterized protein n=1 Tax=Xenoophorus captivus TaxID=1517983 RepID=A0ABV0S049_9TELE
MKSQPSEDWKRTWSLSSLEKSRLSQQTAVGDVAPLRACKVGERNRRFYVFLRVDRNRQEPEQYKLVLTENEVILGYQNKPYDCFLLLECRRNQVWYQMENKPDEGQTADRTSPV